ncbi:MAG: hypothetical protein ACRET2_12585, partial [Steroidobacteraceae bacterium]
VGDSFSAVDMVIFPGFQLLKRALERPEARDLASRFMPVEVHYPAVGRWVARIESLPGYERTYPPHWIGSQNRSERFWTPDGVRRTREGRGAGMGPSKVACGALSGQC